MTAARAIDGLCENLAASVEFDGRLVLVAGKDGRIASSPLGGTGAICMGNVHGDSKVDLRGADETKVGNRVQAGHGVLA
jgi:hypothetical protein